MGFEKCALEEAVEQAFNAGKDHDLKLWIKADGKILGEPEIRQVMSGMCNADVSCLPVLKMSGTRKPETSEPETKVPKFYAGLAKCGTASYPHMRPQLSNRIC